MSILSPLTNIPCVFQVGNISLPGLDNLVADTDRLQDKFSYEAFLCHACVGKSHLYAIPENKEQALDGLDTGKILHDRPADYDSVYIHRQRPGLTQVGVDLQIHRSWKRERGSDCATVVKPGFLDPPGLQFRPAAAHLSA